MNNRNELKEIDAIAPQPETVTVGGKPYTLRPLALRSFLKVWDIFWDAVQALGEVAPDAETSEITPSQALALLRVMADKMISLTAFVLGVDEEEIAEKMLPVEWARFWNAFWKVNHIEEVLTHFFTFREWAARLPRLLQTKEQVGQRSQNSSLPNTASRQTASLTK